MTFSYARPRFSLVVLGVFAGVGILLVGLGVYSVMAYTVSRQTHEIGIRMALGAGRYDVVLRILRTGGILIAAGVITGLLASFAATRVIATQLWNVSPADPWPVIAAVVVVAMMGASACLVPARRATRVDPATALRHD